MLCSKNNLKNWQSMIDIVHQTLSDGVLFIIYKQYNKYVTFDVTTSLT